MANTASRAAKWPSLHAALLGAALVVAVLHGAAHAQTKPRPKAAAARPAASAPVATAGQARCDAALRSAALARLNALRQRGGRCAGEVQGPAPALAWNDTLERAAAWHAQDLAHHQTFSHEDSTGRHVDARVSEHGYRWGFVAENLAGGSEELAQVMALWQASPGHCRNLHAAAARDVGLACVRSDDPRMATRWVLVLAAPLH